MMIADINPSNTDDSQVTVQRRVMVKVVEVKGSAPREEGAVLTVFENNETGTIGGGSMEYEASIQARLMLSEQQSNIGCTKMVRMRLDPEFDQCCGGVVILLFEYIPAVESSELTRKVEQCTKERLRFCLLTSAKLDQARPVVKILVTLNDEVIDSVVEFKRPVSLIKFAHDILNKVIPVQSYERVNHDHEDGWVLSIVEPNDFNITLFGAGHVGKELVRILSDHDCHLRWVDNRINIFPDKTSTNIECIHSEAPVTEVATAPPGSLFLVMTHSHALDFELCDYILAQDDVNYLGLIGSKSKAIRFKKQLTKMGLTTDEVNKITCPIGIEGIKSKHASAIAISVAAQLLLIHQINRQNLTSMQL